MDLMQRQHGRKFYRTHADRLSGALQAMGSFVVSGGARWRELRRFRNVVSNATRVSFPLATHGCSANDKLFVCPCSTHKASSISFYVCWLANPQPIKAHMARITSL